MSVEIARARARASTETSRAARRRRNRHPGAKSRGLLIIRNNTICTNAVTYGLRHENTS